MRADGHENGQKPNRRRQGYNGGGTLLIEGNCGVGLAGIAVGEGVEVSYWMHQLDEDERKILQTHPRGDRSRQLKGVLGLRSPVRPSPIGMSVVDVVSLEHKGLLVTGLDALDGSPILDVKSGPGAGR